MEKKEVLYNHTVSYRITGPQSIQRLDPLLKSIKGFDWKEANSSISSLHFVWETSCKKTERNQHAGSIVCNRLHNSQIIEDKSNLAFLQIQMATVGNSAVLETFVTRNLAGACDWFNSRWCQMSTDGKTCGLLHETGDTILDNECSSTSYRLSHSVPRDSDWWIVKASKGNGGRDVWVVHPNNYIDVLSQLSPNEGKSSY